MLKQWRREWGIHCECFTEPDLYICIKIKQSLWGAIRGKSSIILGWKTTVEERECSINNFYSGDDIVLGYEVQALKEPKTDIIPNERPDLVSQEVAKN